MSDELAYETDPDWMAKIREEMRAMKNADPKKGKKSTAKTRKAQETKIRSAVDGRSLRATGRTEQFNFKCRADIKQGAVESARDKGLSMAEWMEIAIEDLIAKFKE